MNTPVFLLRATSAFGALLFYLLGVPTRAADQGQSADPLQRRSGHPYLTYSDANIAALKARVAREPAMAEAWQQLLARADRALVPDGGGGRGGRKGGGEGGGAADLLCLAYRMTGDKKYGERAKQHLLAQNLGGRSDALLLLRDPPWNASLGSGEACARFAVMFDSVYDLLSPTERKTLAARFAEKGILPILDDWVLGAKRIHALDTMGHNWWSAIVFGAGIGAMAILDEEPRARGWVERVGAAEAEWLRYAGSFLDNKPSNFDARGGFYESVNYAGYAVRSYLPFRRAWRDAFVAPSPAFPLLDRMAEFFMHVSYPRSAGAPWSLNFGDGSLTSNGVAAVSLLWTLGHRTPAALWYLKHYDSATEGRGGEPPGALLRSSPSDLLYAPTEAELTAIPETPDLPRSQIFSDMGWVTWRSSWDKDATMLALKSGYTWNHAHADNGSFILFHRGKNLLIDSGNSSYPTPEYDDYYRQSVAHNVVTFNGKSEHPETLYFGSKFSGTVSNMVDAGDFRYVLADATGPSADRFIRNFRSFLWIGDVILVIDDVKSFEPGQFEWLLHFNGEGKRNGLDVRVTEGDATVIVRPLFPEPFPNAGLPTDYPERMRLIEKTGLKDHEPKTPMKYFAFAPAELTRRAKFITAIIPVKEGNPPLPKIERFRSLEVNGVRITQNGTVTKVMLNLLADGSIRHRNANLVHNGWETDAYLTVMTWPEGANTADPDAASHLFVGNGSYLRRDGKVVLDSLSKVYLSATKTGRALDVSLQGQPVINAHFRATTKVSEVRLNGNTIAPRYDPEAKTMWLKQHD
ncbi:MAG: heparinase II/III family protein [Opitutaceae bacterium]|nr:heparinase II/III family protein [Opitutaceae bacterium]